jgi:hypothetical protein
VRVGIEFAELSDLEGRLLAMLFRRDAARGARHRPAAAVAPAASPRDATA